VGISTAGFVQRPREICIFKIIIVHGTILYLSLLGITTLMSPSSQWFGVFFKQTKSKIKISFFQNPDVELSKRRMCYKPKVIIKNR